MSSELQYHPPRHDAAPAVSARTGAFIVFEGGDGSGKSTQTRLLAERLRNLGHPVVQTREPGGTVIGESLRALVLEHGQGEIDARTEALIYAAARAAHAHQRISPALAAGDVVVCDRYIDSSAAYQGGGRRLGLEAVTELSRWATEDLQPDLTIFLHLDQKHAQARIGRRGSADRLESEPDSFHRRVAESFETLASRSGPRAVVEASGTVHEVAAQVWAAVHRQLPQLTRERPAGGVVADAQSTRGGKA